MIVRLCGHRYRQHAGSPEAPVCTGIGASALNYCDPFIEMHFFFHGVETAPNRLLCISLRQCLAFVKSFLKQGNPQTGISKAMRVSHQ